MIRDIAARLDQAMANAGFERDLERVAPGHLFHEECGYLWLLHDNRDAQSILPFGCPPDDLTAQQRWGRA